MSPAPGVCLLPENLGSANQGDDETEDGSFPCLAGNAVRHADTIRTWNTQSRAFSIFAYPFLKNP